MKYLTARQASELLKVSQRRIRGKINQKRRRCFPGAIMTGKQWMIPEEEVLKELEQIKFRDFNYRLNILKDRNE